MIRRGIYALFLIAGVAGAAVTVAVGNNSYHLLAYILSVVVGLVVYYQANKRLVEEAMGTTILGITGGLVMSEIVLTAASMYVLAIPVDFAAWRMWLQLLFPWTFVLALILTGYFCAGLLDMLR